MKSIAFIAASLIAASAVAAPLTPGNLLVTNGATNEIHEFTRFGVKVQTFVAPRMYGQDSSDHIRDLIVDSRGNVHVYNGTFRAGISTVDPSTGKWTTRRIAGLNVANGVNYGKLALHKDFLFMTDHQVGDDTTNAIVRLNLLDGSVKRFATQAHYNDVAIDLKVGKDGLLYALNGAGSPSGRFMEVYNPETLALVKKVDLPTMYRSGYSSDSIGLHVDWRGNIVLNQLYGPLYKLAPDLQVTGGYSFTRTSYVDDMDVSQEGRVLVTQFDGRVVVMNNLLEEVRTFEATGHIFSRSFGAWIPTPPSANDQP